MRNIIDLTGKKFNRLTVIKFAYKSESGLYWLCKCDCGNEKNIRGANLKNSAIKSCGCLCKEKIKDLFTTHGLSKTIEYKAYKAMKERCYNKNCKIYKDYGGRGIKVCDEWLNDFTVFLKDIGKRPSKQHSIDRIYNDGNYEPENCKWATSTEQNRNRRNNHLITYGGETLCLSEWAERLDISYQCLWTRIKRGWSIERAFTQKVKK